jgi:protein ImuB
MTHELYACIYAREFSVQALLRLRPDLAGKPVAVLAGDPPREMIWSANSAAYTRGVQRGMTRVELETLVPVTLMRRSAAAEDSARHAFVECVRSFSPRIQELPEESAYALIADLNGMEKLLGNPQVIARAVVQQATTIGFRVSVAIADNVFAALCCARGLEGITVVARGEERRALASLPLSVLHLTPEDEELLGLWGIRTLGSLASLPEKELIARMGQRGQRLRQLACGEWPHVLAPLEEDAQLEESMEFDCGLESLDSVLFVASPMLQQLLVRTQARSLALAALILTCSLEGGTKHRRTIRPALPTTKHAVLLKLLHLDLIQHPPSAAVLGLTLQAEAAQPNRAQLGLFAPQFPEPMRLEVMLARLSAIVGGERVGAPELKDSHAREAFSITRFTSPREMSQTKHGVRSYAATRVLRPPERVSVQLYRERPSSLVFRNQHYRVLHVYGPWMRSGEWWKPEHWSAEEWDLVAASSVSEELFCKLAHDLVNDCWQIEAIYD